MNLHIVQRPPDGRRDVPDRRRRNERGRRHPLLLLVGRRAPFHVVGRQGVGAAEVEGAAAAVGGGGGGGADVDLLGGDGAVVADLASGDAEGFLAEHVAL